jgi:hypothetical protein
LRAQTHGNLLPGLGRGRHGCGGVRHGCGGVRHGPWRKSAARRGTLAPSVRDALRRGNGKRAVEVYVKKYM